MPFQQREVPFIGFIFVLEGKILQDNNDANQKIFPWLRPWFLHSDIQLPLAPKLQYTIQSPFNQQSGTISGDDQQCSSKYSPRPKLQMLPTSLEVGMEEATLKFLMSGLL